MKRDDSYIDYRMLDLRELDLFQEKFLDDSQSNQRLSESYKAPEGKHLLNHAQKRVKIPNFLFSNRC